MSTESSIPGHSQLWKTNQEGDRHTVLGCQREHLAMALVFDIHRMYLMKKPKGFFPPVNKLPSN